MKRIGFSSNYIVVDEDRVLLVQRAKDKTHGSNGWSVPGGGVEVGENYEQAAIREMKEET